MRLARPAFAIASAVTLITGGLTAIALSAGAAGLPAPSISQYPLSHADRGPGAIAAGPDGNLWFTESATTALGIITPTGTFSELPGLYGPGRGIALDSGGNLWVTEGAAGYIARVSPSRTISELPTVGHAPHAIAAGPGGMWFTDPAGHGAIGLITTAGQPTYHTGLTPNSEPWGITDGPDGHLWFTEAAHPGRIGELDPASGTITEFTTPTPNSAPSTITAGPDGNLWFTESAPPGRIGRISPATGAITEFSAGLPAGSAPQGIAAGPDGNLWFTDAANPAAIGQITPAGTITEYSSGLTSDSAPAGIAAGPDGNLWFMAPGDHGSIGRVLLGAAPAPTPAGPTAITGAASAITAATAVLAGTVGPGRAAATTYHFDWGTTAAYGQRAPASDVTADSSPDAVTVGLTGLQPGTQYHYRLGATTCGGCQTGTAVGADATFTTPDGPVPPVGPSPAPKPASAAIGRTAVAGVVSGTVLVRAPGSSTLRPLAASAAIPMRSLIDATRGVLHITTALDRHGRMQTATVWGGAFVVGQKASASAHGMTTFTLAGRLSCPARGARAHALAVTAWVAAKPPTRSLWATDHHGQYTTRGQNSVATVRGTVWQTIDTCAGTVTYVKRGTVAVRDLRRHGTVVVRAGHSYLARR
jgi:streptogramin lyase